MYIYLKKNQVIRNAYVIEILWHCNVVEQVIKDVIVTEEHYVLHFVMSICLSLKLKNFHRNSDTHMS